ncbi:GNAT family N-acetyltransferase [Adlercreutzia murintestinalis]|uniref:GNAT family N-acetyltransferase n=1 Tax=Adlercreutzia murintestinalis TaxID=2941325 RepID=UPI00203D6FE4|nr:GNAT family N-acetyltransferase [Adlercreutzia murintestinalis]
MKMQSGRDAFEAAQQVRRAVFMEEQGYQNEFDAIDEDDRCVHVALVEGGNPLGCARVFPVELEPDCETAPGRWVFGRLAVMPQVRKGGLGSELLVESERIVQSRGGTELHLHAQCQAQGFYEKHGYVPYGEIGYDEGEPHQWMMKRL